MPREARPEAQSTAAHDPVSERVVGLCGQGLHQARFRPRQQRGRVVGHVEKDDEPVQGRQTNERVDIAGIQFERAFVEAARLRHYLGARSAVDQREPLKIEIHGVRVRRSLRAARFGGDHLGAQLVGEPRDDLVLHGEKVGHRLVEALGPEMAAGLGLDQLHIDAHPIPAALDAAFEHVAHVQLAADLPEVGRLAFVGERACCGR